MHLPRVSVRELTKLEVNDHQAAQAAVKEEQIDPIPGVANSEPALTAHECEISAQLEHTSPYSLNFGVLSVSVTLAKRACLF